MLLSNIRTDHRTPSCQVAPKPHARPYHPRHCPRVLHQCRLVPLQRLSDLEDTRHAEKGNQEGTPNPRLRPACMIRLHDRRTLCSFQIQRSSEMISRCSRMYSRQALSNSARVRVKIIGADEWRKGKFVALRPYPGSVTLHSYSSPSPPSFPPHPQNPPVRVIGIPL
jgi:hypothetical protein